MLTISEQRLPVWQGRQTLHLCGDRIGAAGRAWQNSWTRQGRWTASQHPKHRVRLVTSYNSILLWILVYLSAAVQYLCLKCWHSLFSSFCCVYTSQTLRRIPQYWTTNLNGNQGSRRFLARTLHTAFLPLTSNHYYRFALKKYSEIRFLQYQIPPGPRLGYGIKDQKMFGYPNPSVPWGLFLTEHVCQFFSSSSGAWHSIAFRCFLAALLKHSRQIGSFPKFQGKHSKRSLKPPP